MDCGSGRGKCVSCAAMAMQSKTQRTFLLSFIISIASCGLVGIYCLLLGRLGPLEEKILGTTAAVGGASILGLAAAIPWERRRWHPIGPIAIGAIAVSLSMIIFTIWIDWYWSRHEWFFKSMSVVIITAVALPHIGLISLARLKRSYEWIRMATVAAISLLGGLIMFVIVTEIDPDFLFRLMGILGIGDVCGTIAVPILHRVSAIRTKEAIRTTELVLSLTCPRCSKTQMLAVGRPKCAGCGLQFSIAIEEEHCENCGYVLYGIDSAVCPECGAPTIAGAGSAGVNGAADGDA